MAESVDVVFEGRAFVVCEVVRLRGGQLQRPAQEGGHLAAGDGSIWAVGVVSAAGGYSGVTQPVDVFDKSRVGDIAEEPLGVGRDDLGRIIRQRFVVEESVPAGCSPANCRSVQVDRISSDADAVVVSVVFDRVCELNGADAVLG